MARSSWLARPGSARRLRRPVQKIDEMGGIHPDFAPMAGYTVSPREIQPIQNYLCENLGVNDPMVRQIGCVIGTNAGPGAFGLAFFDKDLDLSAQN